MIEVKIAKSAEEKNVENIQLDEGISLKWDKDTKQVMYLNENSGEELKLNDEAGEIKFLCRLNDKYFATINIGNTVQVWGSDGALRRSFNDYKTDIISLGLNFWNNLVVVYKNNCIASYTLDGYKRYEIEIHTENLNNLIFANYVIQVLHDNRLEIYDSYDGKIKMKLLDQNSFLNDIKRLNSGYFITLSSGNNFNNIDIWNSQEQKISSFDGSFDFNDLIELEDNKIAVLTTSMELKIIDLTSGKTLSKYKSEGSSSKIVQDFKKLIKFNNQLEKYKREKGKIEQFPHFSNNYFSKSEPTENEIKDQNIDIKEENTQILWNFFNRPLFGKIAKILKKEENQTNSYIRRIKEDIEEYKKKSKSGNKQGSILPIIIFVVSVILIFASFMVGASNGINMPMAGAGGVLLLIAIILKSTSTDGNMLNNKIQTLEYIQAVAENFIKNVKDYRRNLYEQIPVLKDETLYDGAKVFDIINTLAIGTINEVAMDECGVIEDDIINPGKKPIVINSPSILRPNKDKINKHNLESFFWSKAENKFIFAVQFFQYIYLSENKIDVFSTHYDFIQNKFIGKIADTFYYKDVTNISKQTVEVETINQNNSEATKVSLKVSSSDSIDIILYEKSSFDTGLFSKQDNKELEMLQNDMQALEDDASMNEEEKNDELELIKKQIKELSSKDDVNVDDFIKNDEAQNAIKNIRAQIRKYKEQ